ncbi:NAD(P)-dependent oxidoreductase [Curtobacterium sp. MCPF17_003]|uniref:NAD(P)-dependent oxidoreductase n=1 Tax=Curtobacterium sp. MCPF17_003 TaxID=2175637 RepID=UPI0015E8E09F|nr:NAD(P)-dependent oxidoreductase [Curtobacterium sp. MCPF17_003]
MTSSGEASPTIGVLGVGRMGGPIATVLAKQFAVNVFDVDPARADDVPTARWCNSGGALAAASDVLVTVLPGAAELRAALPAVLSKLRPSSLWIDLTSGDPVTSRELAARAERHGVAAVSAPMGGSVAEARASELTFFVSGPNDAVDRAVPILNVLAATGGVRRIGHRVQDGQIVKLLANGLWFANALAAAEALLIGQGLGLDVEALHGFLQASAGGSRFLDEHADQLLDGDYLPSFGIDRVVEELDTIRRLQDVAGVNASMLNASARHHHAALDQYGPALGELLGVRLLEERAGRKLRR